MRDFVKHQDRGISLIGALVATGIVSVVAMGLSNLITGSLQAQKSIEIRNTKSSLQTLLTTAIDCQGTFEELGIDPRNPGNYCSSDSENQVGPFLRLRRKTLDGSKAYFTGPLDADGSGRFGSWSVRASCSSKEQSLVIKIARKHDGGFLRDPLTRAIQDWKAPQALVAGGSGSSKSIPLCFSPASAGPNSGPAVRVATAYKGFRQNFVATTVPQGTRIVSLDYDANYNLGYGWESEDKTTVRMIINLDDMTHAGTTTHTGGNGTYATIAQSWPVTKIGDMPRFTGDRFCQGYCTHQGRVGFNPVIRFNESSRRLVISNFYNAVHNEQGVALFEFH